MIQILILATQFGFEKNRNFFAIFRHFGHCAVWRLLALERCDDWWLQNGVTIAGSGMVWRLLGRPMSNVGTGRQVVYWWPGVPFPGSEKLGRFPAPETLCSLQGGRQDLARTPNFEWYLHKPGRSGHWWSDLETGCWSRLESGLRPPDLRNPLVEFTWELWELGNFHDPVRFFCKILNVCFVWQCQDLPHLRRKLCQEKCFNQRCWIGIEIVDVL